MQPGTLLLVGSPARHAAALAECISGVEIVALDADLGSWPDVPMVSRMVSRPGVPFFTRSLRGVVADGGMEPRWLAEAARVVAPLSRLVVVDAPGGVADLLSGSGLRVLASEGGTVVAVRG